LGRIKYKDRKYDGDEEEEEEEEKPKFISRKGGQERYQLDAKGQSKRKNKQRAQIQAHRIVG
jgi:hypothetical protein